MIAASIEQLFPGITFGAPGEAVDCVLRFDDGVAYIAQWNRREPQPTQAEIDAATPAAKAAEITEAIKARRDQLRTAGCPIGNGVVIHSDDTSRIQQIGLVMLGNNIPAGLKWKAMGGTYLDMTPTLAQQIFGAQAQRDTALFAHAEKLIADVKAAADPEKVDITVGWPD